MAEYYLVKKKVYLTDTIMETKWNHQKFTADTKKALNVPIVISRKWQKGSKMMTFTLYKYL